MSQLTSQYFLSFCPRPGRLSHSPFHSFCEIPVYGEIQSSGFIFWFCSVEGVAVPVDPTNKEARLDEQCPHSRFKPERRSVLGTHKELVPIHTRRFTGLVTLAASVSSLANGLALSLVVSVTTLGRPETARGSSSKRLTDAHSRLSLSRIWNDLSRTTTVDRYTQLV